MGGGVCPSTLGVFVGFNKVFSIGRRASPNAGHREVNALLQVATRAPFTAGQRQQQPIATMHFFKQQQQEDQDDDIDFSEKSETVYKQHPVTPSAPELGLSDDEMTRHLPMAIVVPIDSPGSSIYPSNQHPPVNTVARRPASQEEEKNQKLSVSSNVRHLPMLLVFHLGNFVLAVTAFSVVVTFLSLAIGLLPLCCVGVVVFQMTTWVTEYFARLDTALANLLIISGRDEKLRVHHRITSGLTAPGQSTVISQMTFLSSQTVRAMVYFLTIKFAVGFLSCTVVACVIGTPLSVIAGAAGVSGVEIVGLTFADNPLAYVFAAIGVFVVGVLLLRIVASLSWKLTEAACAETSQDRDVRNSDV